MTALPTEVYTELRHESLPVQYHAKRFISGKWVLGDTRLEAVLAPEARAVPANDLYMYREVDTGRQPW